MKRIQASELEGGDDHEFLVRLYTHVLDRWPDRDGYSHYLGRIDGKPEARTSVIRDVARSEEAKKLDVSVIFPEGEAGDSVPAPVPPQVRVQGPGSAPMAPAAASAGGSVQTPISPSPPPTFAGALGPAFAANPHAPVSAQRPPHPGPPVAAIAAELAALRAQVMRLGAEVAALREVAAAAPPSTTEAPPGSNLLEDVAQQIDALFALGLAAVEARLVALEGGQHGG
ncbi:MAG: hypothetical protein JWO26_193 [Rhodospirillales bacterium]|nr:hypothetical protein [Rhodospirillales bacterium]